VKHVLSSGFVKVEEPLPSVKLRSPVKSDSIAVLPFENAGGDPEVEYLSDGIAETIINNLSRLQQLRVIPRTTAFAYKSKSRDPVGVGRCLGARIVLTGHVDQHRDRIVVGVELIDTALEAQVWGRTFDYRADDILRMQNEIASECANFLRFELTESEKKKLSKFCTENRTAYHLFLKAVYFANKWNPEGFQKGLAYARQAIETDPTYSEAYAGLASRL
jgi:adenylate cyclase